ncbi:hypothetical protein F7P69_26780 [Cellulosimicrobium funkei]|nr:hypothetical protein [Cellulosimicrobium funkei]
MSYPPGTVQRLEKPVYILGLGLLGVLGVGAAVLGLMSLWQPAVACLGLAIALLAPLQFVQARRQVRTQKAALRQVVGSTSVGAPGNGSSNGPANQEFMAMLSRNNRLMIALTEQKSHSAGDVGERTERMAAEIIALRSEISHLRTDQADARTAIAESYASVRADLAALTGHASESRHADPAGEG